MNGYEYKSLLEIALEEMKKKKKPRTMQKILEETFQLKGMNYKEEADKVAQFEMDFMLSGHFICCGENKDGTKLWDLKNRQPTSLLDKDGSYLDDLYSDDEDVVKNELTDDMIFAADLQSEDEMWESLDREDDEEEEEHDEIEEELSSTADFSEDDDEIEEIINEDIDLDDDDDLK